MEALIDFNGKCYVAHLLGEGEWINVSFVCARMTVRPFDFIKDGFITINDKIHRLMHLEALETVSDSVLGIDIVCFKVKIDANLEDL